MKLTMTILLAAQLCCNPGQQQDTLLAVFWNLENFYDYHSSEKPLSWTAGRFYAKCDAVAKTLIRIADEYGRYPDIAAFCEIENSYVSRSLVSTTLLSKLGYKIVHYESPDHRNMDCSLIYRESVLRLKNSSPRHIYTEQGEILASRDILLAEFPELAVLVNHHPSQIGGKTKNREEARRNLDFLVDSLLFSGTERILALGDFNEALWPGKGPGTIKYNGKWEKIDGSFSFGSLKTEEYVYDDESLMEIDRQFGGIKPRRCFKGPSYVGGISDHLPVVLIISF